MAVPGVIRSARRQVEHWMVDECVIMDRTVTYDSLGVTETWVARDSSETCRFGTITGFAKSTDAEPGIVLDAVIMEPAGSTVQFPMDLENPPREQDRLVQPDGQHWVVVSDITPHSDMAAVRRVIAREWAGE